MLSDTRLSVGGAVGAIKGNIFEQHFKKILENLGYIVVRYSFVKDHLRNDGSIEITEKLLERLKISISSREVSRKIVVWRYRLPPYNFSEIDFYIPSIKVGFWVSYIGRIKRKTCPRCFPKNKTSKFNEFHQSKGVCPHCKKSILPNRKAVGIKKWICNACGHIVDPLTLDSIKCAICGGDLIEIEDKSASTQAHKQFYYRLAELIDIKTSSDITCIFIAYNFREEWRIWHKAFDLFFDRSIFVFDSNPTVGARKIVGLFDSDEFNSQFSSIICDLLINKPKITDTRIRTMFTFMKKVRENKEKSLGKWENFLIDSRKILTGHGEVKCYPIRYSIYYLLKQLMGSRPQLISPDKYNQGLSLDETSLQKREQYIISKVDEVKNENAEDIWLNTQKGILKSVLINYFERARKYKWYKNLMLLNFDYKMINSTPFLEQFEPLEELLFIKLDQIKKNKRIIKKIDNEPCFDVEEPTVIQKLLSEIGSKAFVIGNDARVLLNNDKEVVFQCKTSCSFEKWDKFNKILSSGISYKDAKRMIGHNFLANFDIDENNNVIKKERIFVVVLDGHWGAGEGDKLKNLRIMYLLGVDEIFFADELFAEDILPKERQLTNFLVALSRI